MSGSFGPGRESSSYGGSKDYGGGSHNQAGSKGNQGRGSGSGSFQGGGPAPKTRDQMMAQDAMGARVAKALGDFNDKEGESWFERNIANPLASLAGFNQIDPTRPGFSKPGAPGMTGRADWGWDPAGAIGSALGAGIGAPLGTGFIADQISAAFGRPMEINLGPDVIGGPPSMAPSGASYPNGTPPAGGPGTPAISGNGGQVGVHPTGGPQNPGLAANPAQAQPGLKPMSPPKTIAPVPTPKPLTSTPYGWGQVTLPPPNYFMSQMT